MAMVMISFYGACETNLKYTRVIKGWLVGSNKV